VRRPERLLSRSSERKLMTHYDLFSDNLHRYLSGQPLTQVVDKHMGY